MSGKRFEITFIVNGQPFEVKVGRAIPDSPQRGGSCGTNPANPLIPGRRSVNRALLQAPNYS